MTTRAPSSDCAASCGELVACGVSFAPDTLAATASHTPLARAAVREPTRTAAPCRANSRTTRCPTGPVPPSTSAVAPGRGTCFAAASTAAAAVVLAPLASIITDTRTGPKNVRTT
jgi:hypothetical protein